MPKVTELHGHKLVDNYFWLRDKKNPEVRAYLEAENVYTDAVMKPTQPLQKKLYDEMLSRIKETDVEVPYKKEIIFIIHAPKPASSTRFIAASEAAWRRRKRWCSTLTSWPRARRFMRVAAYDVSEDGNLLAYSTDNTGFRQYVLAVKDLRTGKLLADHAEKVGSVVWANDNKTLFYTVEDAAKRQYRLYRHTVGTSGHDDLVYEEKDERFNVYAMKISQQGLYLPDLCQSYHERGAVHFRRPAGGSVEDHGAAQTGRRVLSRPQRRLLLYPGE